jgi:hypothetical protein
MRFLGLSPQTLQCDLKGVHEFEPGPWPCLSPVCQLAGKDVIVNYDKYIVRKNGRNFGRFTCVCGHSYLRCVPDLSGSSRTTPFKIERRGHEWDRALSEMWQKNVSIEQMTIRLASTEGEVKRAVMRLDLPLNCRKVPLRRIPQVEQTREGARERMLLESVEGLKRAIVEHPSATRNELRKNYAKNEVVWLAQFAPEVCNQLLPPPIAKNRPKNPKQLDWESRDVALSK